VKRSEHKPSLLIVQVEPPQKGDGGDYFYRTHAPGIAMSQEEGVYVVNLTNLHRKKAEIMAWADVLILKNICDPDVFPLIRNRKANGQLTVYEIADDLSALQPWNPVHFFYKVKENLALVYRLASSCDALQVTVPELKRLYGHLNEHCEVFPNRVLHVPLEISTKEYNEVIVGWGGSHGHLEDLAEIAGPLSNWIMTRPNVVLNLMCSDPMWRLFDSLPKDKKIRTLPGSIEDYFDFLAKIDVGIAPLKDTPFNRSRSDVKFLEYAVSGVVPVMACLEPYLHSVRNGETGFLYENSGELIDILNRLVGDVSLLRKVAKAARQYVMRARLQLKHGLDRIDFYMDRLKSVSIGKHQDGRAVQRFKVWAKLEEVVAKGRHLRLMSTRFEDLLHDGLVTMQLTSDKEQARRLFQQAMTLEPTNYLPFLFGAPVSVDPIDSLRKALELQPDSLKARILLGEECARRGKIIEAFQSFESALKVYPDYEIAYLRAADLLKKLGKKVQADILFEEAKELEVYHP